MTMLWVAIALVVVGFLVNVYGTWLQYQQPSATAAPGLPGLLAKAIQNMLTSLTTALDPSVPMWKKICSFGSVLAYLGAAVFVVWAFTSINGGNQTPKPTPSAGPTPSASA
jgi:hypothetical protein